MTLRSFRKRPPFHVPDRARALNLPCDPKISARGTHPTYFPEFSMCPGPQELGETGDNSYDALFGRVWAVLYCDNLTLRFLQWDDGTGIVPGLENAGWTEVTDPLLPLPTLTGDERSFTLAFDQSARIVYAYELDGLIHVTRWDNATNAYVQNVTFAGRDPRLLTDASVLDPRSYPTWGPREWHALGLTTEFRWTPNGQWYSNPVLDSDVVIFYLAVDRTTVRARVQRQLYLTVVTLWEFSSPIVLDAALAISERYQLLVSDTVGTPLTAMLVSAAYADDWRVMSNPVDAVAASAAPETPEARATTFVLDASDDVSAVAAPEGARAATDAQVEDTENEVAAVAAPEAARAVTMIHAEDAADDLAGLTVPEAALRVITSAIQEDTNALNATASPEAVRVRRS